MRKLRFHLVTHDKPCQILVSLTSGYVAMVCISAVHQYCLPSGHVVGLHVVTPLEGSVAT